MNFSNKMDPKNKPFAKKKNSSNKQYFNRKNSNKKKQKELSNKEKFKKRRWHGRFPQRKYASKKTMDKIANKKIILLVDFIYEKQLECFRDMPHVEVVKRPNFSLQTISNHLHHCIAKYGNHHIYVFAFGIQNVVDIEKTNFYEECSKFSCKKKLIVVEPSSVPDDVDEFVQKGQEAIAKAQRKLGLDLYFLLLPPLPTNILVPSELGLKNHNSMHSRSTEKLVSDKSTNTGIREWYNSFCRKLIISECHRIKSWTEVSLLQEYIQNNLILRKVLTSSTSHTNKEQGNENSDSDNGNCVYFEEKKYWINAAQRFIEVLLRTPVLWETSSDPLPTAQSSIATQESLLSTLNKQTKVSQICDALEGPQKVNAEESGSDMEISDDSNDKIDDSNDKIDTSNFVKREDDPNVQMASVERKRSSLESDIKEMFVREKEPFKKIVVIGNNKFTGILQHLTKNLPVVYLNEDIDYDQNGMAVFRNLQDRHKDKTLFVILSTISELAEPVNEIDSYCTTSCSEFIPTYAVKNDASFGDRCFKDMTVHQMAFHLVEEAFDFWEILKLQLRHDCSIFFAPIMPMLAFRSSEEERQHTYLHKMYKVNPDIPQFVGNTRALLESAVTLERIWFDRLMTDLDQKSLPCHLLQTYSKTHRMPLRVLSELKSNRVVASEKNWSEVMAKIMRHYLQRPTEILHTSPLQHSFFVFEFGPDTSVSENKDRGEKTESQYHEGPSQRNIMAAAIDHKVHIQGKVDISRMSATESDQRQISPAEDCRIPSKEQMNPCLKSMGESSRSSLSMDHKFHMQEEVDVPHLSGRKLYQKPIFPAADDHKATLEDKIDSFFLSMGESSRSHLLMDHKLHKEEKVDVPRLSVTESYQKQIFPAADHNATMKNQMDSFHASSGKSSPSYSEDNCSEDNCNSSLCTADSRAKLENDFLTAQKDLESEYERYLDLFLLSPEIHPEYEGNYSMFMEQYKEKFTGDFDEEHFSKLWISYWKELLESSLCEEYSKKKQDLKDEYKCKNYEEPSVKLKVKQEEEYKCKYYAESSVKLKVKQEKEYKCKNYEESSVKLKVKQEVNSIGKKNSHNNTGNIGQEKNDSNDRTNNVGTSQYYKYCALDEGTSGYCKDKTIDSVQYSRGSSMLKSSEGGERGSKRQKLTSEGCYSENKSSIHALNVSESIQSSDREKSRHSVETLIIQTSDGNEVSLKDIVHAIDEVNPHLGMLGSVTQILSKKISGCGSYKNKVLELFANEGNLSLLKRLSEKTEELSSSVKYGVWPLKLELASIYSKDLLNFINLSSKKPSYFGLDLTKIAKATYNLNSSDTVGFLKNLLLSKGFVASELEMTNLFSAVKATHLSIVCKPNESVSSNSK